MSIGKASKTFSIPFGTLYNRLHGLHPLKTGGQTRLSAKAEQRLAETVITLAEWKVPVDLIDVPCEGLSRQTGSF